MARLTAPFFTGLPTDGVSPHLLGQIQAAVQAVGGTGVVITSAKRPPGLKHNDVVHSNHITGDAIDGYAIVGGQHVPIGQALLPVASKFGLRSGDVANFDPRTKGGWDPIHVDDGANVGLTKAYAPTGVVPTSTTPSPASTGSDSALLRALYLDPAHPDVTVGPYTQGALTGDSLVKEIITAANKYGVDPRVPLSVAPHEGGLEATGYGDWGYYSNGRFVPTSAHAPGSSPTSFGPFALHEGGALPQTVWDKGVAYANQWANSPAGIDYAMKGIAAAVGKSSGLAGVASQVENYEKPGVQYRAGEIAKAEETYRSLARIALPDTSATAATTPPTAAAPKGAAPTGKTATAGTTLASQLEAAKPVPLTVPSSGLSSSLAALLKVAAAQGPSSSPFNLAPVTSAALTAPTRLDLAAPPPIAPLVLSTPAPPVQPLTLATAATPAPVTLPTSAASAAVRAVPVAPKLALPNLAPSAAGIIAPAFAQWLKGVR